MRKPEGRRGASSAKDASIGANISSAGVPIAFSSIPLQSYQSKQNELYKKVLEIMLNRIVMVVHYHANMIIRVK